MLPMHVLYGAIGEAVSIELKTGECYNGYVVSADYFMNFELKDVTITDKSGEKFVKVEKCFLRGNSVKYIRVGSEAIEKAETRMNENKRGRSGIRRFRGARR